MESERTRRIISAKRRGIVGHEVVGGLLDELAGVGLADPREELKRDESNFMGEYIVESISKKRKRKMREEGGGGMR